MGKRNRSKPLAALYHGLLLESQTLEQEALLSWNVGSKACGDCLAPGWTLQGARLISLQAESSRHTVEALQSDPPFGGGKGEGGRDSQGL